MNQILIVKRAYAFRDMSRYIKGFKPTYFDIFNDIFNEYSGNEMACFAYISNYVYDRGALDDDDYDDYKYHNFLISNIKLLSYRKRKDYNHRKKYFMTKAYRDGQPQNQNNSNNNIFTRSIIRNNAYKSFIKEKVFG